MPSSPPFRSLTRHCSCILCSFSISERSLVEEIKITNKKHTRTQDMDASQVLGPKRCSFTRAAVDISWALFCAPGHCCHYHCVVSCKHSQLLSTLYIKRKKKKHTDRLETQMCLEPPVVTHCVLPLVLILFFSFSFSCSFCSSWTHRGSSGCRSNLPVDSS